MRITRWVAVVLLAGACATTRGDVTQVRAELDEEFRVRAGEAAQVDDLRVRFLRVTEDSRCPINARCVRAGFAKVAVELRTPSMPPLQSALQTPDTPTTTTYGPYVIEVLDLQPGRDANAPTPRFEAAFRVRRR